MKRNILFTKPAMNIIRDWHSWVYDWYYGRVSLGRYALCKFVLSKLGIVDVIKHISQLYAQMISITHVHFGRLHSIQCQYIEWTFDKSCYAYKCINSCSNSCNLVTIGVSSYWCDDWISYYNYHAFCYIRQFGPIHILDLDKKLI